MEKKCKNCRNCVRVGVFGSVICNQNKNCKGYNKFEPKPQTNRQWLESLSDEELANEINNMLGCEGKYRCFLENTSTLYAIKDWLQAEHKE